MKNVLLVGDSICMGYSNGPGYAPFVAERLASQGIRVTARACEQSGLLLERLTEITSDGPFDVIHFNCGLHDLKRDRGTLTLQTRLEDYEANVGAIADRLLASGAAVVWATISPVDDQWHQSYKPFDRRASDVVDYNTAALRAIGRRAIAVNDLHAVVVEAGARSLLFSDGVHFTPAGSRRLADAVAESILRSGR